MSLRHVRRHRDFGLPRFAGSERCSSFSGGWHCQSSSLLSYTTPQRSRVHEFTWRPEQRSTRLRRPSQTQRCAARWSD